MRALAAMLVLGLAGCSSEPRQSIEIRTTPPGAAIYRIDGVPPGARADLPHAVSAPADVDLSKTPAVGRTPTVYTARGDRAYRLHVALEGYVPYELIVPGANVQGEVALALDPGAALRDEEAVLEAILRRGPLGRADLDKGLRDAVDRVLAKELLERIDTKPDVWDLAPRALVLLRERLGAADVEQALLESRRSLSRGGGKRR